MPQLAHWLTFIEEFDYEIVHRTGKRHSNADGLSRRARPPTARHERAVESASKSTKREQLNVKYDTYTEHNEVMDSEQSELEEQIPNARLDHVRDKEPAETEVKSSVRESLAARQQSHPELGKLVRLRLQSAEQPALALMSTESESAKRLTINGSAWKYKNSSYDEESKESRTGTLQPVIAGAAYERWYIDLIGPHPRSERGHVYILICVDAFTKWAEAFPLRSKKAEPIAKVLVEQVFCRIGTPVSLLSAQGKEVDGNIMKHVCRMLGIDKLRTTPYKPPTNQVERLHRSINAILGKTVASHQKDWDTRLSFAMSAYRASHLESTGYTLGWS